MTFYIWRMALMGISLVTTGGNALIWFTVAFALGNSADAIPAFGMAVLSMVAFVFLITIWGDGEEVREGALREYVKRRLEEGARDR